MFFILLLLFITNRKMTWVNLQTIRPEIDALIEQEVDDGRKHFLIAYNNLPSIETFMAYDPPQLDDLLSLRMSKIGQNKEVRRWNCPKHRIYHHEELGRKFTVKYHIAYIVKKGSKFDWDDPECDDDELIEMDMHMGVISLALTGTHFTAPNRFVCVAELELQNQEQADEAQKPKKKTRRSKKKSKTTTNAEAQKPKTEEESSTSEDETKEQKKQLVQNELVQFELKVALFMALTAWNSDDKFSKEKVIERFKEISKDKKDRPQLAELTIESSKELPENLRELFVDMVCFPSRFSSGKY